MLQEGGGAAELHWVGREELKNGISPYLLLLMVISPPPINFFSIFTMNLIPHNVNLIPPLEMSDIMYGM